jgi:hypothetical protein
VIRWFLILVGTALVLIGLFAPNSMRDLAALFVAF